jgi:hypothetical protein
MTFNACRALLVRFLKNSDGQAQETVCPIFATASPSLRCASRTSATVFSPSSGKTAFLPSGRKLLSRMTGCLSLMSGCPIHRASVSRDGWASRARATAFSSFAPVRAIHLRWASRARQTAFSPSSGKTAFLPERQTVFSHLRRQTLVAFALLPILASLGAPLGASAQTAQAAQPPQPPATILLLRHAEKLTDGRIDLAPAGFARAKDLPQLFLGSNAGTAPKFPRPDVLFATHQSQRSNRPFETVEPLSHALNLPVNTEFLDDDYAGLASLLLSGKYAGKVVLVSWHHGRLPQLAAALGIQPQPAPWPPTQFDRIWRIDWHDGKATLTDLPQQLMPGDSK